MVIENLINLTKENGNLENGGKGIPTFDMLFCYYFSFNLNQNASVIYFIPPLSFYNP